MSWGAVYKVRPRVALRCPACGHGVHAKVSSRKLRYFAHDPGRPDDCVWLNESLEHHLLKLELATSIRAVGWHAELEVRAPDGSWLADVLAASHDGNHRVAWEVQLSPITDDDIADRTLRYRRDGIGVCWVSTADRIPWIGSVPSIRVREPKENQSWTVIDGVAGFRYTDGAWNLMTDVSLVDFIGWVLREKSIVHQVLPRYRRIWRGSPDRYVRRHLIWTSPHSVAEETRHNLMRQRQEEWKRRKQEQERAAAQRRKAEEEARRQDEQRQREEREAAERAMREQRWAEQRRQWELQAEQDRLRREAEEHLRQEQAQAAEQERLRQEQREQQAAHHWWAEVSAAQDQQLRTAVADPVWKKEATRLTFDDHGPTAECGYGIPIYRPVRWGTQLYGVLRPCPASLHRVPRSVPVFVRNAREAQLLTESGAIESDRVIHFDLPDYEQLSLI
ncbi:competence protein CoiA family protein [Saccharopolyspora shandongensis]|uniref:competence protein CoiA family protein n=1 Tax=Saccharopolyspora shandongensis TaxID=418495 RepID=UPI0033DCEC69